MKKCLSGAFLTLALLFFSYSALAQELDSLEQRYRFYSDLCQSEKLFLHLDRTYYAAGETIWFNGYLEDAARRPYVPMSNFIYVELLDKDGHVYRRVKIKRSEEGFPGSLLVPDDVKGGDYTLRAYTLWQTARPAEYMFHQSLKILGPYGEAPEAPKTYPEGLDVTFYPEGGRFFAGQRSKIGFKAMDPSGRSVEISGLVKDEDGTVVCGATTRHDGMGMVTLNPVHGKHYSLVTEGGKSFPLPEPSVEGASLNVSKVENELYIKALGFGRYTMYIRDVSGTKRLADVDLSRGPLAFRLSVSDMMPGINHLLLVAGTGEIVSERLYFIYDQSPVICKMQNLKKAGGPRSLVRARVDISDAGGKIPDGEFSVSVLRGSLRTRTQNDNLVSYMSLSSELKGTINDPKYYFDPEVPQKDRENAMNLLMMIQGWRYYDMPALMSPEGISLQLPDGKEFYQTVRGRIVRQLSSKEPKDFLFTLLIPSKHWTTSLPVTEGSRFLIDSLDFEESTDFLINIGRNRIGFDYSPKWDGDKFAEEMAYQPTPGLAGEEPVKEEIPLVSEIMAVDTIAEAKVVADPYLDNLGLLSGKVPSSREMEIYKDRTLIEYLSLTTPAFTYDGDQMYNRRVITGSLVVKSGEDDESSDPDEEESSPYAPVKLIVKDVEDYWFAYNQVRMEEIETIVVSTHADSYYNAPGGVVAIKLKEGVAITSSETSPNLIHFVPLGYSRPSKFYSPRYDQGERREEFDCRNTVYWNPCIDIKDGHAEIEFCTTDQEDYPYYVRIEGKTSGGRLFSGNAVLDF